MDSLLTEISSGRHRYRQQVPERSARDTQPWTTTRCHRLLRPLKTHIFALRREVEQETSETLGDEYSQEGDLRTSGGPPAREGKYQHTYSRRGRKPGPRAPSHSIQPEEPHQTRTSKAMKLSRNKSLQPGEIILPTPVIRRAREQVVSPIQQPALSDDGRHRGGMKSNGTALDRRENYNISQPHSMVSALETELLPLRHRISPTKFSLYQSILRALHALLIATASPVPVKLSSTIPTSATKHTKSLMAMCLRKVPEYIGELEYWEQHDAEEKGTKSMLQVSEVSSQVYEAVEDMLPSGRGCPQLRTIVREHGMKVIRNAVLEGVLDDHFSLLLVALCFKTKAFMEAEGLLEVILDRTYPKPKSVDSTFDEARSLAPLKTLRDLAQESGRSQFPLRQLSKLLELQKLPLEWLSTKQFASIWSGMVKTLSGDGVCNDTVSCTAHMITLLFSQAKSSAFISRPDKDDLKTLSQQTLISAVSAMTSIGLLRQEVGVKAARYPVQSTASVVAMRIRYIIEACVYKMKRTRKPGWIPTVLNLSAYLLNTTQNGSTLGIRELWHRVLQECTRRDAKRYYEAATAFLSSLARCCGQGAPEPSHHYLTKFCDQLDSTASVEGGKSRQIRADCAFLLAERTNDMRDLVFAESFNVAMESLESVSDTPNKRSSTSGTTGFRWDGDISEWVTKTPAPRPRRPLIEERSPTSVFQTCADETASDSGVSGVEASSAKPCDSDEKIPRRRTRSSATRANRCTQPQGSALGPSTRKRDTTEAGLLSQQLSEHDAEEEQEEEEEDGANSRPRSYHHYRARGQENRASLKSVASGEKRRRVGDATISKPRRAMLRTITNNTCHADLSDDELGL